MPGQDTRDGVSSSTTCSDEICGTDRACLAATATSETPRSGEFQQKPMSTETGSSLATGAESDMDIGVTVSDTGVDVVEGAAADSVGT